LVGLCIISGKKDISLWDEQDAFYYDAIQFENGSSQRLRIRSLVASFLYLLLK
jgi:hypothetical protein